MSDAFRLDPADWAALRALLDEALDLPAAERARWVDALDDAAHGRLKPRLRELLSHAGPVPDRAMRLLETMPAVETDDFAAPPGSGSAGEQVGPYRLLRELGHGGMASVWLAERTDILQRRQVALKLPHGAWRRAGLAERLAREREILATLEHPNIARLYDAGVDADGQPYLALEFVEGERIDAQCQRKALDVPARLRLFLQVARAVAHAHANLVVHRDLKPSNILVTEAGDVKLLDFGIAKLLEGGQVQETELTQAGGRALTPDYAAPEQILGQPVGTAADVYALGVVLFELLVERRPYVLARDSRAALEEAVLHADAPAPSSVAPAARRRALRGDLDTIVGKALKKAPGERYGTVLAFADDVERHLAQRPVLAQPDRVAYRVQRFVRRHRWALAASSAVSLALVSGAGLALWQAAQARAEQRRAEAVKSFVTGLFTDANPFSTTSGAPTAQALLESALERLPPPGPDNAALRVELLRMIGSSLIGLSQFERADAVLAQAVDEGRRAFGPDDARTLGARVAMVEVHRMRNRGAVAQAELDDLIPRLRADPVRHAELLREALANRAHVEIDQGRHAEAQATAREALALSERLYGRRHPATARQAMTLASAEQFGSDPERALAAARDARDLAIDLQGGTRPHAKVLDARFIYGRALGNAGRWDESVAELGEVLQQTRALLGDAAPMGSFIASDVARFELERGHPAAALPHAERALATLGRNAPAQSYTLAMLRFGVARVLQVLHRNAEADALLVLAFDGVVAARGADSPPAGDIVAVRALVLAQDGRADAAWALLQPRLEGYRRQAPLPKARGLHAAGLVQRERGSLDAAAALLAEALAALPDAPPYAARRDQVLAEQARLAVERGDGAAALALLGRLARPLAAAPPRTPEDAQRQLTEGRARLAEGDRAAAAARLQPVAAYWQREQPGSRMAVEAERWSAAARGRPPSR